MSFEGIMMILGGILLLLALIGGGISIPTKPVFKVPPIPTWRRWVAGLLGFCLIVAAIFLANPVLVPQNYAILQRRSPPPTVTILSPSSGQQIATKLDGKGSGEFVVTGTSTHVANTPRLRVVVLVQSAEPFSPGWYPQPPVNIDQNGQWKGQTFAGSSVTPIQLGHKVNVQAVVVDAAKAESRDRLGDPRDMDPMAMTPIVEVTIGSTN